MRRYALAGIAALALAMALVGSGAHTTTGAGTVVVKPSAMSGWYFWNDYNDTFAGSPGELVSGPAAPPSGAGSVRLGPLTTASGATGHSVIATDAYYNGGLGTPLANITALSYATYQPGPTLAVAVQFDVRYRTSDTAYGGRLVFEPYENGAVTVGSGWQSWTPLSGTWWASKTTAAGSAGLCPQGAPCTWAAINAAFPAAKVFGRFMLKSGSNWSGFDGNADNLTVGVSGVDTTYDFEAETPCTTTCYVDAATGNDSFGGNAPGAAKKTIQAAVNQVSSAGTVNVAAGTYNEDVTVSTANVQILGAGIDISTIVGPIGGGGSTIQVAAGGVVVDGFTITRAGDNVVDWNGALNTAGVAVQSQGNTVELRNSKITGMRTGIDINNSNGNSVHNNIIDNNRTGMIFRNQTDSTSVVNNFITNNWTIGVLFLDGSGGTNIPVQSAATSTFSNNNISGNWYGQVEDRQSGGSIPAAPANPKNFALNWWGTTLLSVSTVQGGEPGYSAQIPVIFGGTATAPGGQPEIKGTSSANIDYVQFRCSGVDTSPALGFQPSGVLCNPPVTTIVTASSMTATGWLFYNDEIDVIDPTLGSFVTGPGTPALGTGSAQISVTGSQRRNLATYQFAGTPLADITALRFRTYNPSAGNGGAANRTAYLNFNVDFNGSDTWQKRLVFGPTDNGTVLQDTWQEWDAVNGGASLWHYSGATWPITGQPGGTLKTWTQILSDYPGVRIRVTDAHMGIRVGAPYPDGYTENIDTFTFGTVAGTTIFNFEDTPPCTTVCYVNGTTGNDAFDGSTATSPKKTIQGGINQVSVGGAVNVAAGTYDENVTIPKALTLAGAGEATTTVRPAVSNPNCGGAGGGSLCAGGSYIMLVQADNVTIHDLTLDGDNPALTSGIVQSGADLDARNGIITNHALGVYQNLVVHHTTIKNIYLRGIYASSGGSFDFHHDTVQNVKGSTSSIGMFNFGGAGTFANNTVSDTNDAIASNWSMGSTYTNNAVTDSGSGIHTDNNGGSGGVADALTGNTVSNCKTNGYGVWVFAPFRPVTVSQNTVTNCAVGLTSAGQQSAVTIAFTDNEVDGQSLAGSTGVYVTTSLFGFGDANSTVTMTGNIIKNNADGFYIESTAGKTASLDAQRNSISGNTNSGVSTSVGGTFSISMTPNWWGSDTGPAHASNPLGTGDSVPNGVIYSPWIGIGTDAAPATAGFQLVSPMTWIAGPSVCGATCIQAAIDDASNGDTVKAKTGVFNEHVVVNKSITLTAGSNPIIDGGGSGDGITVTVPNVTVSLFEVRNVTNGIVVATGANNATITGNVITNHHQRGVNVDASTNVLVDGNTIDGQGGGTTAAGGTTPDNDTRYYGIFAVDSTGTLSNNIIKGITHGLANGAQSGVGIRLTARAGAGSSNMTISGNNISDVQKNAMVITNAYGGTSVNANVTGNTVAGNGPITYIAQNGIQVSGGAMAVVSGNNVSGYDYTPNTAAAIGILLFGAGTTSVTGNNVHNLMEGMYVQSTNSATVTGNSFMSVRDTSIFVYLSNNGTYSGNTVMGQPASTGMYVYDSSSTNSVTGNAFRNGDFGVIVDFTGAGTPASNLFNGNCLAGNIGAGVQTSGSLVGPKVNATGNWWGAVDGANPPGSGDSIIPGDGSTIDASAFLIAPVAGCPLAPDADADGIGDSSDNCPTVYNPAQTNTDEFNYLTNRPGSDGLGDACDSDISGDGYGNVAKTALGKNLLVYCPIMRADVNTSGKVQLSDLIILGGLYGQDVPPAPARDDQTADNKITLADLIVMTAVYGQSVSACP